MFCRASASYTPQGGPRLGLLTLLESQPTRGWLADVVRVGEDAISSMVLPISYELGDGVTAGSSFRDVVLKAGPQAKDKSQSRRTCS
jgi:hypothetical protein